MIKGIALKVAATFTFALMSATIKGLAQDYPIDEVVLMRSVVALLTLVAWLSFTGEFPRALATTRIPGHILRSLAGSGGMFASFIALTLLPLAEATAFSFAAPLMVVPLASLLLREDARPLRWLAVGVGFFGVLVMLSEHFGADRSTELASLGAAVAMVGAVSGAVATIQTRRLTRTEDTGAIVFYFSATTSAVSAALLLLAWIAPKVGVASPWVADLAWVSPSFGGLVGLVAVGVLGGAGQILMTQSYRYADASVIAAFDYTSILWTTALGYVVFAETPSTRVALGACVVVACGIAVLANASPARRIRWRAKSA